MGLIDLARRGRAALRRRLDPRRRLVAMVTAAKEARAASGFRYDENPRVSFVLLSFNHRANAAPILERLRRACADAGEVIVCEDGSVDGSADEWLGLLTRPNEFMIRSNDLHEIRAYNRAMALARGEYVCILQDDDIPPEEGEWLRHALGLFAGDPKLAVLGANQGWVLDLSGQVDKIRARAVYGYGEGPNWSYVKPIPTRDPRVDTPFMYVEGVSVGPIVYRRDVFTALGGFDGEFSAPGEPGILFDHDLCMRAWQAGWRVGVYGPAPFRKYVGGQGTFMFASAVRKRNAVTNFQRIHDRYRAAQPAIDREVGQLNAALVPVGPSS